MNGVSDIQAQLYKDLGIDPNAKESKNTGELGQEDFLELMITQLRNQDPLKPMESGEFLGQIAQFGTVSGIQDLQNSFSDFSSKLFSSQALEAASLVGRQVLVPGDTSVHMAGNHTVGSVDLPNSVNQLDIKVYTATGQLVRTINMGAQDSGMSEFAWDGVNDDGQMMPSGVYRFEAETSNGTTTRAADTYLNTQVLSVELGRTDGSMTLETSSLGSVDFSTVKRIS